MLKDFLLERRSWILLFISLQILLIFTAYLDSTIPIRSVLYIVFLSGIIFAIFIIVRYKKETHFYNQVKEYEGDLDLSNHIHGESPFEKIIESSLIQQTEKLKNEASRNFFMLEQEKDDLLAWIHEVKTPLTAMHLMIDRLDNDAVKSHLTYEWLRIHLLLDQQLHQKRIPFIQNDFYVENIELEPLLFSEIKTLQSWCIQKKIGFDLLLATPEVLSDSKWLAFILRQILTNAVKYSDSTDIIVKSYRKEHHTYLEITDFGRGIDPKDLPRIFEKGFTSTANHHDHAATGMGLYLTKKVAETLKIKIKATSTLGEGTTFTLVFPQKNEFIALTGM